MTPVFCCGAECGVIAASAHFKAVSGTATFSTTTVRSGLRSLRCNPSAATQSVSTQDVYAASSRHIGRFYVYFATLPSADVRLARFDGVNDLSGPCVRFKQSDSKIYAAVGTTLGASGVAVTTGQFYLIDYDYNVNTAGADFCDVKVEGTACGQATATGSGFDAQADGFGCFDSCTADVFFDDIVLSGTAGDYPIGAGKVLSSVPNVDGTHTATGTTLVKGTTGAPTGGGNVAGATDVFNWVNARPIGGGATDATRLVNQQTAGATLYAEVDFEATTEANAPRAVEVLTVDQQAATGSGGFSTKLNDNGTEDVIITRSAAGVTSDRYVSKQYATMVGGGAWTLSRFNALKARFGYSGDATPDQYWRGIMIEAEFLVSSETITTDKWQPEWPDPSRPKNEIVVY